MWIKFLIFMQDNFMSSFIIKLNRFNIFIRASLIFIIIVLTSK